MSENQNERISVDYRDSTPSWPAEPTPPEGAPNVVVVVLDDVGYGQIGCYGSDIRTPHIDRLAEGGTRLTHFNTTGICSATRSCILTGRNHHSNHMGAVAELATGFPGYDFRMPKENGTLAEVLRDRGYATFAVGKWHLTPAEEHHHGGPKKRWPLGRGFERFYGFHGSDTSQYHPDLVYDNHQIQPPRTPEEGYHLSEDLADRAIEFTRDLHNAAPGKPFFMYFALGAMHTPLHVGKDYIDRYRGQFDLGWDAWREVTHKRQLEMGILPKGTELTPRPDWIPAWDSLDETQKRVYARLMEVYAGFLEHTDAQIGRLVDDLAARGQLNNTIFVVVSDNGASSEGGQNGMFNNVRYLNGIREPAETIDADLDKLGSVESNPHYPYGWAWAGNTPFRRWKQEVHAGGVADPCIVFWPDGLRARGEIRSQYAHAIDVMPTLLDLIGVESPEIIDGIKQTPVQGFSFDQCLKDAKAPSKHHRQYYEIRGCRALYEDGWKLVTYHPRIGLAWDGSDPTRPYDEDTWELYNLQEDFSERHDLAAQYPERVAKMVETWFEEAWKHDVFPLDNRGVARLATRKSEQYGPGRDHVLFRSEGTIREFGAIDFKNRSHSIEAELQIPPGAPAEGMLLSLGNGYGGYALFVIDGKPTYVHNYASLSEQTVQSVSRLEPGPATLRFEFEKTGENAGHGRLLINGELVGEGEIAQTIPHYFGGAEMSIGKNSGYPVSALYRDRGTFRFTGTIDKITLHADTVCAETESDQRAAMEQVALAIQ